MTRSRRHARFRPEFPPLEARIVLSHFGAGQLPLPTRTGQVFVLDDFDNKVTRTDLGTNYFAGNAGATDGFTSPGATTAGLSTDSNGTPGGSLQVSR